MKIVPGDQMMYEVPGTVLTELRELRAEVARLRREIHDTATWLSLWTEQGEDHPRAVSLRAALGEDA